jgi:hypothetical protein
VLHVFDCGTLLGIGQLAIEPGHVDIEQLALVLCRLLALRAPAYLQTDIGERGFQRFLRTTGNFAYFIGECWGDVENAQQRGAGEAGGTSQHVTPVCMDIRHRILPLR